MTVRLAVTVIERNMNTLTPQQLLFTEAHTHYAWQPDPVGEEELRRLYDVLRWAPTGGNGNPLRVAFVRSAEAKEKLRPAVFPMNVEKMMTAPVTAVIAYDVAWYEKLTELAPSQPGVRDRIAGMPAETRAAMGQQSATLQAGYLVLAARLLGLDCGPMGGFTPSVVDEAFFPDGAWRTILLVNLGHGDPNAVRPRQPRLEFADACTIL